MILRYRLLRYPIMFTAIPGRELKQQACAVKPKCAMLAIDQQLMREIFTYPIMDRRNYLTN